MRQNTCAECFDNFWPEFGGRVCAALPQWALEMWPCEVYVWDDRAKNGVHAAFAFSLLFILLLLAGVYLIDRCSCFGRCLPQEIESTPDELEDEDPEFLEFE